MDNNTRLRCIAQGEQGGQYLAGGEEADPLVREAGAGHDLHDAKGREADVIAQHLQIGELADLRQKQRISRVVNARDGSLPLPLS